jgi:hypothetical protein
MVGRIGTTGAGATLSPALNPNLDLKAGGLQGLSALTPVPTVVPAGNMTPVAPVEEAAYAAGQAAALPAAASRAEVDPPMADESAVEAAAAPAGMPAAETDASGAVESASAGVPAKTMSAKVGSFARKVISQMSYAFAANNQKLAAAAAIPEETAWDYRGLLYTPRYIEDQYLGKMLDPRLSPGAAKQYKDEAYRKYYAERDAIEAKHPGIEYHATLTGRVRMALAVGAQNHQAKVAVGRLHAAWADYQQRRQARIQAAAAIPEDAVWQYRSLLPTPRYIEDQYLGKMLDPRVSPAAAKQYKEKAYRDYYAELDGLLARYPELPYRNSIIGRLAVALQSR